jgi:hypothetical protein
MDARAARRSKRRRRIEAPPALALPPGQFEVLCRVDAYADYVAVVEAGSAEEAAELASADHGAYRWENRGVAEFDDRLYVTLDAHGWEMDGTQVGDC